jgi:hypothetical protein
LGSNGTEKARKPSKEHSPDNNEEMILQTIPAAVKAMLNTDRETPAHHIDDLIVRYLRVRDSSSIDKLEYELTAVFAGGMAHAARVVAGLEAMQSVSSHTRASQQEVQARNDSRPHTRARPGNSRQLGFIARAGVPVKP